MLPLAFLMQFDPTKTPAKPLASAVSARKRSIHLIPLTPGQATPPSMKIVSRATWQYVVIALAAYYLLIIFAVRNGNIVRRSIVPHQPKGMLNKAKAGVQSIYNAGRRAVTPKGKASQWAEEAEETAERGAGYFKRAGEKIKNQFRRGEERVEEFFDGDDDEYDEEHLSALD